MAFLDEAREKYGELADSFSEKGWPSPAIVFGVLLAVGLAAAYFAFFAAPVTQSVAITVKNSQGTLLSGMAVELLDGGKFVSQAETNAEGMASFAKAPASTSLSVRISDPQKAYPTLEKRLASATAEFTMDDPAPVESAREYVNVLVSDSFGTSVPAAGVTLRFEDGSENFSSTSFDGTASFVLGELPSMVTVTVLADGFLPKTQSFSKTDLVASGGSVALVLTSTDEQTDGEKGGGTATSSFGQVSVSVYLPDGSPVGGVQVSLLDSATGRQLRTLKADSGGTALFANFPIGKMFFVRVGETGKSASYASDEMEVQSASETLDVPIEVAEKKAGDYIYLQVVSSDGNELEGATATLYDSTGKQLDVSATDSQGKAEFAVPSATLYHVTAYAEGYHPASIDARPSPTLSKIALSAATDGNSADVIVSVEGNDGPAIGADVLLYSADGFPLGVPAAYTDADGTAAFTIPSEIGGGAYEIFAKVSQYGMRGESARVAAQSGAVLAVTLEYEPGTFSVYLEDLSLGTPLSNGTASVQDSQGNIISSCDFGGINCTLSAPAEQEVSIAAVSEGFVRAVSVPYTLSPGERKAVKLSLVPLSASKAVSVKFLGLYSPAGLVAEAGNAEYYRARFSVTAPASSKNAGLHAHISGGDFAWFSQEPSIDGAVVFSSASFDSESCYSSSSGNSTSLRSLDVVFPKGFSGTKEIELSLYVAPNAPASSQFTLNYKAYAAKGGIISSSPELESYDSVSTPDAASDLVRQMCRQKSLAAQVKVTASPLVCDEKTGFCRRLFLKSAESSSKSSIEIAKQADFSLYYEVLSDSAIDSIGIRSAVSQYTGAGGLDFASDAGKSAVGVSDSMQSEQRIPVQAEAGARSSGVLNFKAIKAALSSDFVATFYSEGKAWPFHFSLKVTGDNPLKRSTPSPSMLEVGKPAKVRIKVLDERNNPVEDALVTLFDCEGAPLGFNEPQVQGDGSLDSGLHGSYAVSASPVALGRIGVRIEHEQYRTLEECLIEVAPPSGALEASPESLKFAGSSADLASQTVTFSSALNAKSALDLYSDCSANNIPILTFVPPYFSSFTDEASVDVSVLADTTAKTSCQLVARQRISSRYTLTRSVPVSISVKSPLAIGIENPTPTPTPTPTPVPGIQYPAIPSLVRLNLDDTGFAEALHSYAGRGEVTACALRGTTIFEQGVAVECSGGAIHLSADYPSLAPAAGIREAGRLTVSTDDGLGHIYNILVFRQGAPTPTPEGTPTPTPTMTPGLCTDEQCDGTGGQLGCCDRNGNSNWERGECNSLAAYNYFTGKMSLDDACNAPAPLCILTVEPNLLSASGEVRVQADYYDFEEQANSITVDCDNGRSAPLVGCTAGSCSGKCTYTAPGVFLAQASIGSIECASAQVDYPAPAVSPTVSPNPSPSVSPTPTPIPSGAEISSPVHLNLDDTGFADAFYVYKADDISSCELQGPANLTDNVRAECIGRSIMFLADYSGTQIAKGTRIKGNLILYAGTATKKYTVMVIARDFDGRNIDENAYPALPSRIEISINEQNYYFEKTFGMYGFGEEVIRCEKQGFDSTVSSWVDLQYCSPSDQRLQVAADFTGNPYQQLLRMVYSSNPACIGYFGAPQMSYNQFAQAGGQYGNSYGNQYGNQNGYFGGTYQPLSQGYNYAGNTAMPGYNPPSGFYQYNQYPSSPQDGIYGNYASGPSQLQYYNPNTYGAQFSAQFSATLPSSCVPTPLSGYVVFTLKSGASRRIPLIITATGTMHNQPQIPIQPYFQQDNMVKPSITLALDPYTLSRWVRAKEAIDGVDTPRCGIKSDATLYSRISQGTQDYSTASPYMPNYPGYAQQRRETTSAISNANAKGIVNSESFQVEALCSRDGSTLNHELGVNLAGAGISSLDIAQSSRSLNAPQEAYIDEFMPRSNSHQLAPLIVTVGDLEQFKYEPLSGPLQFMVTGGSPSINSDPNTFKAVYDIIDPNGCKVSGIPDATASVSGAGNLPTVVAIDA
ncbi:MAG: carboxypeptidase-like regulatory domain-containing protein, partial [Candidatus Micrarchaeota archaeon]